MTMLLTLTMAYLVALTTEQAAVTAASANGYMYCDAISNNHVTTGDLQLAFDDYFCVPTLNFTDHCLFKASTMLSQDHCKIICTSRVNLEIKTPPHLSAVSPSHDPIDICSTTKRRLHMTQQRAQCKKIQKIPRYTSPCNVTVAYTT